MQSDPLKETVGKWLLILRPRGHHNQITLQQILSRVICLPVYFQRLVVFFSLLIWSSSTVNLPARCCAPATASSALPHIFSTLSSFQSDTRAITFIWLSFRLLCENFLSVGGKVSEAPAPWMESWPIDETCERLSHHTAVVTNFNLGSINNRFRRTAIAPLVIQ